MEEKYLRIPMENALIIVSALTEDLSYLEEFK